MPSLFAWIRVCICFWSSTFEKTYRYISLCTSDKQVLYGTFINCSKRLPLSYVSTKCWKSKLWQLVLRTVWNENSRWHFVEIEYPPEDDSPLFLSFFESSVNNFDITYCLRYMAFVLTSLCFSSRYGFHSMSKDYLLSGCISVAIFSTPFGRVFCRFTSRIWLVMGSIYLNFFLVWMRL